MARVISPIRMPPADRRFSKAVIVDTDTDADAGGTSDGELGTAATSLMQYNTM